MDIQRKKINLSKVKKYKHKTHKFNNIKDKVNKMYTLFLKSQRPCIILGGGLRISKSVDKMLRFIKKFDVPIVTTWSGVDSISHKNKNYIGSLGVYGSRAANFTVQNSDLLLCLGTRLDTRITGGIPKNFARSAKIISVDIDKNELNKKRGLNIDLKINCDLKTFFYFALKNLKFKLSKKNWLKTTRLWKKKYPMVLKEYYHQKNYVNPYVFMNKLSKLISADQPSEELFYNLQIVF